MAELVLTTFDWVPAAPRGYVRDLRVRWALEEAGLAYRIETVPFRQRAREHFAHQPFGQVPWLTDGDLSIFETGAILLHLGGRSEALLPSEPHRRAEAVQWAFAALNSMETAIVPLVIFAFAGDAGDTPGGQRLKAYREGRLKHLEAVLSAREWLAGGFSIADILMADALRLLEKTDLFVAFPACGGYLERATSRPAFRKALADQIAHFAKADAA